MPGRANEALDIVVGCRALAWLEKMDGWSPAQWAERAAAVWRTELPTEPDLFSAPAAEMTKPEVPIQKRTPRGRRVLSSGIQNPYA